MFAVTIFCYPVSSFGPNSKLVDREFFSVYKMPSFKSRNSDSRSSTLCLALLSNRCQPLTFRYKYFSPLQSHFDPPVCSSVHSTTCSRFLFPDVLLTARLIIILAINQLGDRGSTVVKVLCYKSEGRWFDSRWCHWSFSLT